MNTTDLQKLGGCPASRNYPRPLYLCIFLFLALMCVLVWMFWAPVVTFAAEKKLWNEAQAFLSAEMRIKKSSQQPLKPSAHSELLIRQKLQHMARLQGFLLPFSHVFVRWFRQTGVDKTSFEDKVQISYTLPMSIRIFNLVPVSFVSVRIVEVNVSEKN